MNRVNRSGSGGDATAKKKNKTGALGACRGRHVAEYGTGGVNDRWKENTISSRMVVVTQNNNECVGGKWGATGRATRFSGLEGLAGGVCK